MIGGNDSATSSWQDHMNIWLQSLDYSDRECPIIASGFLGGSILGCMSQLFVLTVVIHKVKKQQVKSAADQLMISLTFTDLLACGFLFPMEIRHFGSGECNELESDFLYGTTIFLETLSTLLLQSIAINRALLVFWPNSNILTFVKSCFLCLLDVILALVIVALVIKLQSHVIVFYIYTIFVFGNLAVMALIYGLIFCKLCHRVHLAKKKQRQQRMKIALSKVANEEEQNQIDEAGQINNGKNQIPNFRASATPSPCPVERVRNRAALISVIITLVYAICFIPNGLLTLCVTIDPEILFVKAPNYSAPVAKYLQFLYNLNFILMPIIYAVLSQQFRKDSVEVFHCVKQSKFGERLRNFVLRCRRRPTIGEVSRVGSPGSDGNANTMKYDDQSNQTTVKASCRNNQKETIV